MDFLAIGDTVIDTFIRLRDAEVHCDVHHEHETITMAFGAKIPFEFSKTIPAVGNSANAAVAAARLGLSTSFVSALGKDRGGADCLARFTAEGVGTDLITIKEGGETITNYVLWYGPERTILVKYAAFEYDLPKELPAPRAVYLSGIGEANPQIYDQVADWLEKNPGILFALQPGTFEIMAGYARITRLYARADVLISNKEEYQKILGTMEEDEKKLMHLMQTKGPKTCILTDGPHGAYALSAEGAWKIGLFAGGENAYERTGAGDAFSSAVVVALLLGKSLPEALAWGPINAASVVQKVGAQEGLLTRAELEQRYASAPATYRAVPL